MTAEKATTEKRISQRFWSKVEKSSGCWNWKSKKTWNGYGQFSIKGKKTLPHRVAYELTKGAISKDLTIHHICHNRACVNPEHLEPVTKRENILRGEGIAAMESRRTHCPKGHPLIEGNLIPWFLKRGKRSCLTCAKERDRKRERK